MLWSLIKIIAFVAIVTGLTFGSIYLLESEGGVMLTVGGVEYSLGPFHTALALTALVAAVWVGIKLLGLLVAVLKFLNGDETAISRYFDRNREQKGYKALSDSVMALASGEGRIAMDKARRAERLLAKPELTNLIVAQAAEMHGDTKKAEETYKKLLNDESTRFVGVRGLMKQKLAAGDTDVALKLAENAFALKPRHEEVQDTLLRLQTESKDWTGARGTLNAKLRHGSLPRDVHRRRDAVLALSEAKEVIAEDSSIEAREQAIEANRLSPDLIPAAVLAARSYIEKSKPRYATRLLKKAWDAQPHPDLAAAFAEIAPEETPEARIKRFGALVKNTADHDESKMLLAELYIAAEDFPAARRALGDLYETNPTQRALTIMAAVERGEGAGDAVVKGFLAKALSAPRGPQWVCDNCSHIHAEWSPTCESCHSFDTLAWVAPPEVEGQSQSSAAMLPLIIGALEDKSSEDEEVVEAEEDVVDATPVDNESAQTESARTSV
ncbi:heme biosynthesis protein HemY [Shimia sp. MMG029]|uniref:heme biosynthesis protein HemY n=1 Tax=Shimia sp. MMG029 TaxID=3021978 RepID=UPI0022FF3ACC|nr:heme biosynthesis HemY N-terminal domain-containing protein [Shimia sp. MMG029]MDA5556940.1 heme biosynthesis HemY N-terminal domain-containing protein [Shimia sp. MMG029]